MIPWESYSAEDIQVLIKDVGSGFYINLYDGQITVTEICTEDNYNTFWETLTTHFFKAIGDKLKKSDTDKVMTMYTIPTIMYYMLGIQLKIIPLYMSSHDELTRYLARFRLERGI